MVFDRHIPLPIKRKLRQEVNFGCPIKNCGTPYLKYHHFDPTFAKLEKTTNPTHLPENIIALCAEHEDHADGGKWISEKLREYKNNSFITKNLESEEFGYLRQKIIVKIGANLVYDAPIILRIDGESVIWFTHDDQNNLRLNIKLKDSTGNTILLMEENDWIVHTPDLFDLICPPQGKELEIKAKDETTEFKIRFDDYDMSKLKQTLLDFQMPSPKMKSRFKIIF